MSSKEVKFYQYNQDKNGRKIEIEYKGNPIVDNNIDEDRKLITKFMNYAINSNNMVKNICFLRTILKNYDEKSLLINYECKNFKETIKYDNLHMSFFDKKEKDESFVFEHELGTDINFMFNHENNSSELNIKDKSEKISKILDEIDSLNNIKPIQLDKNAKMIIEIYKLFYNRYPDFTDKNINVKIQTMLSILAEFDITINEYYGFSIYDESNIPMSITLKSDIDYLFPFGQIINIDNPVKIKEEYQNLIKLIGNEIREYMRTENKIDILPIMSKVIYAARYSLSSISNVSDISKYTDCSNEDIESSIKLVKKINSKR